MLRRLALLILLLVGMGAPVQAQGETDDLLGRINNLRASLGLPAYRWNGALAAAAQSQAQWMADTGSISHNRPDGSGPRTRAVNAGYPTTDVSENIYGGSNASAGAAWTFWVNSAIHYRGLTNSRYQEVGVGIASGASMRAYVLVFGNPGGPAPYVPQTSTGSNDTTSSAAAAAPPSYVVGVDPRGFIMHEVQPEDTLGDIALLYGYTWDDLPYMREINELEGNILAVGEVFLVPPHDGTYTPTPGDPPEDAPPGQAEGDAEAAGTETEQQVTATATPTPSATPAPTRMAIATAAAMPEVIALALPPTETPLVVAALVTPAAMTASTTITPASGTSPVLLVAVGVQVLLLGVAGYEFMRRMRQGKS